METAVAYEKVSDIPANPGETVVQLDTGEYVAVSCARKQIVGAEGVMISYHTVARAIDSLGQPVLASDGRPVKRSFKHCEPEAKDANAVARDCILAALGEEPVETAFTQLALDSYSIRVALRAADVVGQVDAGSLL
jgi:hypothetical protein